MFYQKNNYQKKLSKLEKIENLALGSESKKQTNIAKDQHRFFKDQINAVNKSNKNKDGGKEEHGVKTENDVTYFYIGEFNQQKF